METVAVGNIQQKRKKKPQVTKPGVLVARCHEKIRSQRRDYLHKLSRRITDQYDIVAVEDIDMKAMSQCLHFGKSVQDNG